MRHLFSTRLRVILIVALILTAGLAIVGNAAGQSLPDVLVNGFMAPFRAGSLANALWVGFFLVAYYTAYTFFFIPRNALIPEVIPDTDDRVVYYGISTAFFMGSSSFMYAATLFVNLIKGLGVSALWSWRIVFTVFAAIGCTTHTTQQIKIVYYKSI